MCVLLLSVTSKFKFSPLLSFQRPTFPFLLVLLFLKFSTSVVSNHSYLDTPVVIECNWRSCFGVNCNSSSSLSDTSFGLHNTPWSASLVFLLIVDLIFFRISVFIWQIFVASSTVCSMWLRGIRIFQCNARDFSGCELVWMVQIKSSSCLASSVYSSLTNF